MIARSSKTPSKQNPDSDDDQDGEYECEICGDKYNRRSKLKRHLESNKTELKIAYFSQFLMIRLMKNFEFCRNCDILSYLFLYSKFGFFY